MTGAALGAGAGALIGSATGGSSVTAAAAGMGLGALTGAIVGGAIENERAERDNVPVSPAQPTAATQVAQSEEGAFNPKAATIDPTVGKIVNGTRWRLEVFLDRDPQDLEGAAGIVLEPQQSHPQNLDFGPHRIVARAYVETQFGTRMVGRYDRTVQVDPRGNGWTLHFTEADFR